MTPRELEEYTALRETIRERGTARVYLFVAGLVLWGALALATAALAALPIAMLGPLLVLAGVFEAVFSLHVGVERIGRYIHVFHEGDEAGWEHVAAKFGTGYRGISPDPLFAMFFAGATILNFVPVLLAEPIAIEVTVVGAIHLLFIARLILARRQSHRQRALDQERFEQIKTKP